jgi:hypothetical protein
LLDAFRAAFEGKPYMHRDPTVGDRIAQWLYEDLYRLGKSKVLVRRADDGEVVLNVRNLRVGVSARRGDGTFGELVPGSESIRDSEFSVPRGHIATVEIGVEVKILSKSMIKQIDRVKRDLIGQVAEFRKGGDRPICIGIVGINWSAAYHSFEGEKEYDTEGTSSNPHPVKEAREAEERLNRDVRPQFDEFLLLKYTATNVPPYPFSWVDEEKTTLTYGALLTRVSRRYDERFR